MYKKSNIQSNPIKTSFYYGWIIVAIGALGLFFSGPGQFHMVSIIKTKGLPSNFAAMV